MQLTFFDMFDRSCPSILADESRAFLLIWDGLDLAWGYCDAR